MKLRKEGKCRKEENVKGGNHLGTIGWLEGSSTGRVLEGKERMDMEDMEGKKRQDGLGRERTKGWF